MAGRFSDSNLDQVRAASDIVDVVSAVVPLKRSGAGFVALCPFHKEKTPSFHVNPHRQIFHCFGCHKGGDVFRFVQEYENISFPEAVHRLAERAHIPLEFEQDDTARQRRFVKETLLKIHEGIAQRWQAALTNEASGQVAREYLQRRGVVREAVRAFRLGAAPEAWDDTVNWARGKGYDMKLVEQAGLILRKEGGDHYYDRFRGRLMFPIADEQGRIIGFSGRVLEGDEKTAKYINSPETPIFTKGRVCYALHIARRELLDAGYAVICEGQLDTIACHGAGVRNAVAPMGTALTADHARLLRRYVEEVILCFDSDTAGQNASLRSLDDLLASGLAIRVAEIPAPHDPDSYLKAHGPEAFRQLLQGAQGFFDFYLALLGRQQDASSDRGRMAIVRAMGEAVAKTHSAVMFDTYAQKTALRLGVNSDAVRSEFRRLAGRRGAVATSASGREDSASGSDTIADVPTRPGQQEFWLLKLLLLDPQLVHWTRQQLDLGWIQHLSVRRVITALTAAAEAGTVDVATVVGHLEDEHDRSLASEALAESRPIPNRAQQTADVVRRLRDQQIDRELAQLSRALARTDLPAAEGPALLRRQQSLREQKRQRLTPPGEAEPAPE
jgi:DNA primase